MMDQGDSDSRFSRRDALRTLGTALAIAPLAPLLGCGGGSSSIPDPDAGSGLDSGSEPDPDAGVDSGAEPGYWATGGTASMRDDYPDPFEKGPGEVCTLTCASILGPCFAQAPERSDISEGQDGLPVRMAFQVVDTNCRPIEGATIDVWHTSAAGLYSGEDAAKGCTLGDPEAVRSRWFRGLQTTDADGRADFDTCYPGWYGGRAVHVHVTVRVSGDEYVTTQLYFDDALTNQILTAEPVYSTRGEPDTTNLTDAFISAAALPDYAFQTEHMADGAMMAWKTLVIRTSTDAALCETPR